MISARETCSLFFFNDTATTEIYTLSLHDALPICHRALFPVHADAPLFGSCHERRLRAVPSPFLTVTLGVGPGVHGDRKSTRLNSSHDQISYAVFCLKKKMTQLTGEHIITATVIWS